MLYIILCFQFKIDEKNVEELDNIVEMVNEVASSGGSETAHLEHPFVLNHLLPDLSENINFYRYHGSLTTPPCTEGVTWIIAEAVAHIGRDQVCCFVEKNINAIIVQLFRLKLFER